MPRLTPSLAIAALILATTASLSAAEPASGADRAFVAKVSQGGMYEVEAGKVAAERGSTPVVRNFGVLEVHDHQGVGAELKRTADASGVAFAAALNPEFAQRLARLKTTPAAQFDAFYIADMKQIHNKDEGLFAQEAKEGSASYKAFAHPTAILVNAHLGWLNTL